MLGGFSLSDNVHIWLHSLWSLKLKLLGKFSWRSSLTDDLFSKEFQLFGHDNVLAGILVSQLRSFKAHHRVIVRAAGRDYLANKSLLF